MMRGGGRRRGGVSVFHCIDWWRVVFDEAHTLKESSTVQSRAARALLSQQRHVLTGTPVSNLVSELRGLFAFLHCYALADIPALWTNLDSATRTPPSPASLLFPSHALYRIAEVVFRSLSMRHTKDDRFNDRVNLTALPARHDSTSKIHFTPEQRAAYDELHAVVKAKFDDLVRSGEANRQVIVALALLLPLRQLCSGGSIDIGAVRRREQEQKEAREARLAEEQRLAAAAAVRAPDPDDDDGDDSGEDGSNRSYALATTPPFNSLDEECTVCLSEFSLPLQTACGHLYCAACITAIIRVEDDPLCPQCRAQVTKKSLRRPMPRPPTPPPPPLPAPSDPAAPSSSSSSASSSSLAVASDVVLFNSKLDILVLDVLQLQRAEPTSKVLVFSQFSSSLSYLEQQLRRAGITSHRITGDMSMSRRKKILQSFSSSPSFAVFLLSVRTGSVGLTLTAASQVFIVEPSMNWALTEQAIGRVHRLGQKRDVHIRHMIMRESVEERIEKVTRLKREGKAAPAAAAAGADGKEEKKDEGRAAGAGVTQGGEGDEEEDEELEDAEPAPPTMGSMKRDAAAYRLQELETLFS